VNGIVYLRYRGTMHSRFSSEELKEKDYLEDRSIREDNIKMVLKNRVLGVDWIHSNTL
jgi:hypothetical protein